MNTQTGVLFMQSQSFFGSDSMMHSLLMKHYDPSQVEVHVACNPGSRSNPSASLRALRDIPGLHLRPTHFGPSVFRTSRLAAARSLPSAVPMLADLSALAVYVRRHHIDIIHGTEKPRDAFYGVLLAKLTGAKSIVHLHVGCEDWISPLVRWAMAETDAIVAVSSFVAQTAVAKGYPSAKVHVLLNGLDASRWVSGTDGSTVRQELGIRPDETVLAIISRLYHWKGHLELVRALAHVKEQVDAFRLLIVGEDDPRAAPGRGSLTAELRALTSNVGLNDHVVFTGFRPDIPQILAACDIFAMPTFEEPCAVAFLEAMAMERPIIALRSGGTPEIVEDGRAGLLSEPGDNDQLARNIVTLARDPDLRRRMGRSGRRRVETYLTPRRMAEDGLRIYQAILRPGDSQREPAEMAAPFSGREDAYQAGGHGDGPPRLP